MAIIKQRYVFSVVKFKHHIIIGKYDYPWSRVFF